MRKVRRHGETHFSSGTLGRIRKKLPQPGRGFTLVELMIAMALVGMLTAIIYGLFSRTSDSLGDVEGMTEALDRARFGLAQVRNDLQAAGSQATPNSEVDPWVRPEQAGSRIQGVMAYDNWQNQTDFDDLDSEITDANPHSQFSGIVVVGAYDYPQSFFLSSLTGQVGEADANFEIRDNERGIGRLDRVDPFDVRVQDSIDVDATRLSQNMTERLLRISDSSGYFQYAPVKALTNGAPSSAGPYYFRDAGELFGLDAYADDDVDFSGALIDAFWYRVRADPQDGNNLQLVRHRLNAGNLIGITDALTEMALNDLTTSTVVIVDNVVDFRVWFDCADTGTGAVTGATWENEWNIPSGGDCLDDGEPHLARVAHIRLSVRTPGENANRPHLQVVDGWEGFEEENGAMITYNLAPSARGSASVVTVQASVEMTNFAMRGLR